MTKKIKLKTNEHGFAVGDFCDLNGVSCSIQESSVATEDMIRLGRDNPEYARMHLGRKLVAALLPLLKRFVKTGGLR